MTSGAKRTDRGVRREPRLLHIDIKRLLGLRLAHPGTRLGVGPSTHSAGADGTKARDLAKASGHGNGTPNACMVSTLSPLPPSTRETEYALQQTSTRRTCGRDAGRFHAVCVPDRHPLVRGQHELRNRHPQQRHHFGAGHRHKHRRRGRRDTGRSREFAQRHALIRSQRAHRSVGTLPRRAQRRWGASA